MNGRKRCFSLFFAAFFVCFMGTADLSAAQQPDKIADAMIGSSGINWVPQVGYGKLVLNVSSPDGRIFSKTFEAGSAPYFELANLKGSQCPDGAYTYELRLIPVITKRVRREVGAVMSVKGTDLPDETLTQTGYFHVKDGLIVTPASTSEDGLSGAMDIVHADDVIIDGSLCVGNDCYSGLAFGFDTIVLMENNLRIYFDDTSTIQNYPRNDWRIICNDSTDGGGRYFAIEDATEVSNIMVLEAGAPDNSLYVDSYGDVGINTSTPYYELHIVDGDSPCVRLDQDGSYGWTPQKWDLCGNESNFFIRDATHASKLPFRIEPDAPTDSIFIKSNGYVGIGTGSPQSMLHAEYAGPTKLILDNTTADKWAFNASNNGFRINANDGSTVLFRLTNTGDLYIEGDISSNSGSCCGADYVFDPDYALMPILDLAEFIKKERHLPEIPSAEEMKKNGVKISQLMMKLLAKVEELTLYTVSQEETIRTQKDALSEQKELIKKLEERLAALEKDRK